MHPALARGLRFRSTTFTAPESDRATSQESVAWNTAASPEVCIDVSKLVDQNQQEDMRRPSIKDLFNADIASAITSKLLQEPGGVSDLHTMQLVSKNIGRGATATLNTLKNNLVNKTQYLNSGLLALRPVIENLPALSRHINTLQEQNRLHDLDESVLEGLALLKALRNTIRMMRNDADLDFAEMLQNPIRPQEMLNYVNTFGGKQSSGFNSINFKVFVDQFQDFKHLELNRTNRLIAAIHHPQTQTLAFNNLIALCCQLICVSRTEIFEYAKPSEIFEYKPNTTFQSFVDGACVMLAIVGLATVWSYAACAATTRLTEQALRDGLEVRLAQAAQGFNPKVDYTNEAPVGPLDET